MMPTMKSPARDVWNSLVKGDWVAAASRMGAVGLAAGVVLMIGLMVVPLPPSLLDLLLTLNLAFGAVMLMISVLVTSGLRVNTFPSMLLISTLYRLALDVSSTRLILSEGDAGEVIQSFGEFAAGGSFVVGLVVFLIIALVQLIVISKGAERVAEVTARFVTDGIPGRQMAIDSDASLTAEQKRSMRQDLTIELQFYGRMTGAMQFIKGDAVAALVVSAINIVGGLIVGVAVRGMPVAEAANTYTILSVGAGLVSQIPALVTSIAGGILITRVSDERKPEALGETAVNQFLEAPMAMVLAGGMLFLAGLTPGMPTIPFWVLAALTGGTGLILVRSQDSLPGATKSPTDMVDSDAPSYGIRPMLAVVVDRRLVPGWEQGASLPTEWRDALRETVQDAYGAFGVAFPMPSVSRQELESGGFEVFVHGTSVFQGRIIPGKILLKLPPSRVLIHGAEQGPMTRLGPSTWVDEAQRSVARQSGAQIMEPPEIVAECLYSALAGHAHEFTGVEETEALLEQGRSSYPKVIEAVVGPAGSTAIVTPAQLSVLLTRLVEEQVPICNLKAVLETIAAAVPPSTDGPRPKMPLSELAERVRIGLKESSARHWMMRAKAEVLAYAVLDPRLESLVADQARMVIPGAEQRIDPATADLLRLLVMEAMLTRPNLILVVTQSIRRTVWEALRYSDVGKLGIIVAGLDELPRTVKTFRSVVLAPAKAR